MVNPQAFVLDCSVAMAWCFADEASAETEALLDLTQTHAIWVPPLWRWEVASALITGEKKGRIKPAESTRFISILESLRIVLDSESAFMALHDTGALARAHNLSAYDAAYLELAMRTGAPLATRDADLIKAARKAGVRLI